MATVERTTGTAQERLLGYVDDVLTGVIPAGRLVRLAAARFTRDAEADDSPWYLDWDEVEWAVEFAEALRHSKGEWAGRRLILEPWQVFIVGNLFGWKSNETGYRRFRVGYVEVARKNGKSTLAAAVGHKLFVADNEAGAEVFSAATKREQAKIVHEEAKRMVRSSPALREIVQIRRDNLCVVQTNSKYEPLGADADTLDGLNISGAIIDEVHAHKTRDCWDVLETATGARRQPLTLAITTAGEGAAQESICWELHTYTQKVLEGIVEDDTWFGYIASLDGPVYDAEGQEIEPGDDWTDRANWIKANPNLGVSVKLDDLERKFLKAQQAPAASETFRQKHLNEWVAGQKAWLAPGVWQANAGPEPFHDEHGILADVIERYRGVRCCVGADLSSVSDLTAVVFAFQQDDHVDVLPFCWCPRDNAMGRQRDHRIPYLTWARRGQLYLTEGDSVDYDEIRALLRRARDEWQWDIQQVAVDPNNARYVLTRLVEEDGFDADKVVEHLQTCGHMNDPIKQTERLLLERRVRHGGHEPLAWCVSNVTVYTDTGGRVRFDKKNSQDKIDLAVAMVMAVGRLVLDPDQSSAYATRGPLYAMA